MTATVHRCQDLAWRGWGPCPACGADRVACTDCGRDMSAHTCDTLD